MYSRQSSLQDLVAWIPLGVGSITAIPYIGCTSALRSPNSASSETLDAAHRPVKIAVRREFHFKKMRGVLSLFCIPQNQIAAWPDLVMDLREESSPVMLRKIQQHISKQDQVEDRQLWHRRAKIRIAKFAHRPNSRNNLPLLAHAHQVLQQHPRGQSAIHFKPAVSTFLRIIHDVPRDVSA